MTSLKYKDRPFFCQDYYKDISQWYFFFVQWFSTFFCLRAVFLHNTSPLITSLRTLQWFPQMEEEATLS